jgi:hypothetical protein
MLPGIIKNQVNIEVVDFHKELHIETTMCSINIYNWPAENRIWRNALDVQRNLNYSEHYSKNFNTSTSSTKFYREKFIVVTEVGINFAIFGINDVPNTR